MTFWILGDLEKCLAKQGIVVSMATFSKIVRSAGYKWRNAKVVLTSRGSLLVAVWIELGEGSVTHEQ